MEPVHLHYVYDYTDVDRAFWEKRLAPWMPERIVDAHTHTVDPALRREPMTEAMRREMWVAEVLEPISAEALAHCDRVTFPGRQVSHVAMAHPDLAYDIDKANDYVDAACRQRGWHGLAVLQPQWSAERVAREISRPGIIGVKPYYTLISHDPSTRDKHIEADIYDYLPHHALEVLDDRRSWVTLHVSKAARLPDRENIRQIKDIRRRYPNVILVIAHLGRCYTEPHAREGLLPLADEEGLYFDNSAVLNLATHRIALKALETERILYGTDNPVFYMRGRRQWDGRRYINRTSHPFTFNKEREAPQIEATYTLYMYEALAAFKAVCDELGLGQAEIDAVMYGNAERLLKRVTDAKRERREL